MSDARFQPNMDPQRPSGLFENVLHAGRNLPGELGYICFRKLKRRYRWRTEHTFDQMIDDLRVGDLCIDLGANVGEFTCLMADTGADVISFEPDPDTFATLTKAVGDRKNVTLHQKAAGARAETLQLLRSTRYDEDPERFSRASSIVRADEKMDASNAVDVEVVNFVDTLKELDRDVRILKIDIEGSEWDLLDALIADPVFKRVDTVYVETHEWMDTAKYIPMALRFQDWAERTDRPYLNLFWI